jgi:hypothetical protein
VERDREKYEVNEEITVKLMEGSPRSEKTHGGQNLRRSAAVEVEERRHWRRLKASQLDSLQDDGEDDEAHLLVSSVRRGAARRGGSMVGWRWYCGTFPLGFVHREGEKVRRDGGGGAREEGGRGLGFAGL